MNICDSIKLFEKKNCPKNITACKLLSWRGGIKLSKKSMSMTYALGPDQVHVTVSWNQNKFTNKLSCGILKKFKVVFILGRDILELNQEDRNYFSGGKDLSSWSNKIIWVANSAPPDPFNHPHPPKQCPYFHSKALPCLSATFCVK